MIKKLSILASIILLAGCAGQQVPYRTITGDLHKGTFKIKAPNDFQIGSLDVVATADGAVSVKLTQANAAMNPAVIQSSGVVTADAINAFGTQFSKAFAAGIQAAGKAVVPIP